MLAMMIAIMKHHDYLDHDSDDDVNSHDNEDDDNDYGNDNDIYVIILPTFA